LFCHFFVLTPFCFATSLLQCSFILHPFFDSSPFLLLFLDLLLIVLLLPSLLLLILIGVCKHNPTLLIMMKKN
jgi:hypothetical protein